MDVVFRRLPSAPNPPRLSARRQAATLLDHQQAFWNFYNGSEFLRAGEYADIHEETVIRTGSIHQVRCERVTAAGIVVELLDGQHAGTTATLPHRWLAGADADGRWKPGYVDFALLVPRSTVAAALSDAPGLFVSRCHNLFFRLLVKRLLNIDVRCHIASHRNVGFLILKPNQLSSFELARVVGRNGRHIERLAHFAGLERVAICKLPESNPDDENLSRTAYLVLKEVMDEAVARKIKHRTGFLNHRRAIVLRAAPEHMGFLLGKGGSTLEIIRLLTRTRVIVTEPGLKVPGFLRSSEYRQLYPVEYKRAMWPRKTK